MFEIWIKGVLALCISPTLSVGIRDMLGGMDFLWSEVRLRNSHWGTWHRWDNVNKVLLDTEPPEGFVATQVEKVQRTPRLSRSAWLWGRG